MLIHAATDNGAAPARKILVCDNEDLLRALVLDSLEASGYEFLEARDGDEAVTLASAQRPDLVILDMMMPGRTGLEAVADMRRDPELAQVPVIMLTARAQATDREAAAAAGVDRFVVKPFSPAELAAVVAELLDSSP